MIRRFRAAAGLPQIAIHLPTFGLLIAYLAIACLLGAIVGVPTWIQRSRRPAVPVDAAEAPKARRPPPTTAEWIAGAVGAVAGYLPTFMYLEYLRLGGS